MNDPANMIIATGQAAAALGIISLCKWTEGVFEGRSKNQNRRFRVYAYVSAAVLLALPFVGFAYAGSANSPACSSISLFSGFFILQFISKLNAKS